jgi:hypothetical protein
VCKVFSPPSNTKHCLDFSFVFSGPYLPEKLVFIKGDLPQWKVPARLNWDLLTSGRYQPDWKKISALLYIGKGPEYRDF